MTTNLGRAVWVSKAGQAAGRNVGVSWAKFSAVIIRVSGLI